MTNASDADAVAPTALLIDDEEPVRRLVRSMLEPATCRLIEASDGETGLRLLESDEARIDIVLTDLAMPGLDGLDVLDVLHLHRPELPILVTSAFAGTIYPVVNRGEHLRILQKPFSTNALRDAVVMLLERARQARAKALDDRARARDGQAEGRRKVDLVAAAWAIHRQRSREHRSTDTAVR